MRAAFLNVPAHGHTNPTLPVVAELVGRGDEVVYYSTEEFRAAIERTGAAFRPYVGFAEYERRQIDPNLFRLATTLLEAAAVALPEILPRIEADPPDYLIHDSLCCWGAYLARLLHLPAICSVTTFAFSPHVLFTDPSRLLYGLRSAVEARRDIGRFRALARELHRVYGIPTPRLPEVFSNHERLNVVYTSREVQPHGATFDERFRFVGPSIREGTDDSDFPFEALGDRPIVYILLGTLFNDRPDFYRACFEALADLERRVVLSSGWRVDVGALGAVPANFIVRPWVPQVALLKRSVLAITHGGMNSVNEALFFGVPLLLFPQAADQLWVAKHVEKLGAGRVLRGRADARTLRKAVDDVLRDPSFARTSDRLGASLRGAGGYRRAAEEIRRFVAKRVAGETSQ